MFLKIARVVFDWLTRYVLRVEIYGRENIPAQGGAIVAPNHASNWDPVIVGSALPRMVYFMAKQELFKNYFMNKLCRALGAFPLHRGKVDKVAMRTAFEILKRGDLLGIFPEGTRVPGKELGKFHGGMASLALRLGMPIIPVAVIGTGEGDDAAKKIVAMGKPVAVEKDKPTPENVEKVNKKIKKEIEDMQDFYRRKFA